MNIENKLSDQDILTAVIAGDVNLYRELVLRYQNRIYSLFMRQLQQSALAEDLTQEVFVKAYKNLKSFRGESQFYTWLVRIALNLLSTYFQSKAYKQSLRNSELAELATNEQGQDPNSKLEQKQQMLALRNCFSKLKPDFRELLSLCAFEAFSYEAAANYFNVPIGTVRSRLNSARLLIKNCMKAHS
jgi:RNA polymerase sigma-70 factor (ECF subfamily)